MMNFVKIKEFVDKGDKEGLAHFLCDQYTDCDDCFANDKCDVGDTGLIQWLNSEGE